MIITLELTAEQEDALAEKVALRLAKMNTPKRPLTVAEFAEQTNQSVSFVYDNIKAGNINTVPNIFKKLIPASELNSYQ